VALIEKYSNQPLRWAAISLVPLAAGEFDRLLLCGKKSKKQKALTILLRCNILQSSAQFRYLDNLFLRGMKCHVIINLLIEESKRGAGRSHVPFLFRIKFSLT